MNGKEMKRDKIIAIMNAHVENMELWSYYDSNMGVPADEIESIADEIMALVEKRREINARECPTCMGAGYYTTSGAEHHPDCDGSCRMCPIEVPVQCPCETCGGQGSVEDQEERDCEHCHGTGIISYNPNLNPDHFPATTTANCSRCGGTGKEKEEINGHG